VIDEKTIERIALGLELPFGTVARVAQALVSAEAAEPTEPWERLFYWEARVRTASGTASAGAADEARRAARMSIFASQGRQQLDASYRRGKARGFSEGMVAGYDTARDIIMAELDAAAEPVDVKNHRDVLRREAVHG
jgi:hypothetical protein